MSVVEKTMLKESFEIFEIGGGNGTLAVDVMGFLREYHPEVYARCRYNIIEISPRLAERQARTRTLSRHPADKILIHNKSIFEWTQPVADPCFILATEVLDNLAHDKVTYDDEGKPWVCFVCEDPAGRMWEEYGRLEDRLVTRYLSAKANALNWPDLTLPAGSQSGGLLSRLKDRFAPLPRDHPKRGEFIPTNAFLLLESLGSLFPQHCLILADFSELPDAIVGRNAPVVQTRLNGKTVACSTYMLPKGEYDIFFPTDFDLLAKIYHEQHRKWNGGKKRDVDVRVMTQGAFMTTYADLSKTRTRGGYNPMVDEYRNMKFFLTV